MHNEGQRKDVYQAGEAYLMDMLAVIKDVRGGDTESHACKVHNLNQASFRRFIRTRNSDVIEPDESSLENKNITVYMTDRTFYSWKDHFLQDVTGGTSEIPGSDFDSAWNGFMKSLTGREQRVLEAVYIEEKTLKDIAKEFGVQGERIRQILAKALRKARHPYNIAMFLYGVEYSDLIKKRDKKNQEINKLIISLNSEIENQDFIQQEIKRLKELGNVVDVNVKDMGFSIRTRNCLIRAGVYKADYLSFFREEDLKMIRNLGVKCYQEIITVMKREGIRFRDSNLEMSDRLFQHDKNICVKAQYRL